MSLFSVDEHTTLSISIGSPAPRPKEAPSRTSASTNEIKFAKTPYGYSLSQKIVNFHE